MIPEYLGYHHQCAPSMLRRLFDYITSHLAHSPSASEYWQLREPREFVAGVFERALP
jgi:hypothetical protein